MEFFENTDVCRMSDTIEILDLVSYGYSLKAKKTFIRHIPIVHFPVKPVQQVWRFVKSENKIDISYYNNSSLNQQIRSKWCSIDEFFSRNINQLNILHFLYSLKQMCQRFFSEKTVDLWGFQRLPHWRCSFLRHSERSKSFQNTRFQWRGNWAPQ